MRYSDELEKSMDRLERLKANILDRAIRVYVAELRGKWKPKTRVVEIEGYHGSRKGDTKQVTQYWDEYRAEWADKQTAFQGYVLWKVSRAMNRKT